MDAIGWFIAELHTLLGHDAAARFIGVPAGDKSACLICIYERERTPASNAAVYEALAP